MRVGITSLKCLAFSLLLVLATGMCGPAFGRTGGVPSDWHHRGYEGIILFIFLAGGIGAVWGARRPSWDAGKGFFVGTLWGFAVFFVGVVAVKLFN